MSTGHHSSTNFSCTAQAGGAAASRLYRRLATTQQKLTSGWGAARDPVNLVITAGLAAGAVNTVRDWHNTLQVLGVFAPLLSASLWYQEQGSPQVTVPPALQASVQPAAC